MDVELYPITYWLVGFFGCIFVLGVVTNAAVAFASFHDKKLRNSCNILVALCCLSDGLHTCGHITLVYAFASGDLFMDSITCVWFQILPVIGQNCGCAFTVAIGFDRLFACFDPLSYGAKNAKVYTLSHLAGVSVYVGYQLYNVISNLYSMDVICMVPSAYMGGAKEQFWNVSLAGFLLDVVIYAIVAVKIKTNNMKGLEARLFKSLLVILAFLILGHIGAIGVANVLITNIKNPDFKMGVVMDLVIGIPVNISLVSNYFIYYTTSSDYRKAFRAQFDFITRKTSSVGSVNSSGVLIPKVLSVNSSGVSGPKLSMDVELYPITYWLVGFFGLIFVVGVVTNAAVAFASYHDSRLRNSCNILIAFASIADCLHLSGHIVLIYAFTTGNLLMKSTTCVWIEILPIIGQNSGTAFTVAIGIDRVFACFSPVKYGRKNPIIYICCHLFGISLYLAYHFYNLFVNLYPTELICMVPANYLGEAKGAWWNVSLGCCVLAVIVYAIVGLRIKMSNMRGHEMRLFKSLLVILATVICGYVGTFATANILVANIKVIDFKMGILMDLIIGIPVNISLATNYLVYYATSSDYRRVFKGQIAFVTGKTSTVRVIGRVSTTGTASQSVTKF